MSPSAEVAAFGRMLARQAVKALVCRLPPATIPPLPVPAGSSHLPPRSLRFRLRSVLRRGGIPARVETFALVDNPRLRFVNADSLVLHQLYWFGEQGWEPELLPWWRHFCRRSSSIVEIGANVGYFTVQGATAAPHARYVAIEPHPTTAEICRTHLALNGVTSVELLPVAAVADAGVDSVELLVPREQLALPTVAFTPQRSELPSQVAGQRHTSMRVPAVDVRRLIAGADLIKIDAEGQEHALLAAGWDCLVETRPTVFVEMLPGTARLREISVRLCDELGYRCYAGGRDRLVRLAPAHLKQVNLAKEYGTNDIILTSTAGPQLKPGESTRP